ncbi:nmrA-like family domain-containing protein 1 [Narcine bancroftii]|uniref:nmrA-like family domain-containing protein 1 n=1 Tax=Narcine bancroftii TaxID=1343680 RepID=UPI0038318779
MTETVSVFGADRQQGNAVATALLEDGGFTVRAVVQKLTFPSAQLLQAGGAHIMLADIDDPASTDCALSGADKCVAITHTNLNTRDPLQDEILQGYRIAEACKKFNIKHVVLEESRDGVVAAHHVHRKYSLQARHLNAKACINDYMNELDLPKTEMIVPFYFENFLTKFKPRPAGNNTFLSAIPMGEVAMDGMSIKQIGRIMTALLKNPERWIKKSCFLSAGRLTIQEYPQILTHHLHPKQFKDSQISVQEFVKSFGGPGAEDLGNMFEFCKRGGQKMNISMSFKLYPELQTFQQWVSANTTSLDS